jgi:hypothetical protein
MPGKGQYSIDIDMLQLQIGGWRGTSSLQVSSLQSLQGRDAKEKVTESTQDYNRKGILFQPHHPRAILHGGATQQHSNSSSLSHPHLHGTGTTNNKYQVSQFKLLMQTVFL